ncbi:succinate dehydrogenase, hydrophobic membrane anchor protein [Ottowia pentelensis]|uniref:Succinate dehydrogenase hydrophobic membrane anchor subunit n=1 Tax=Ottowia pentelensis TaxID=511108 RepID=A0ABV6PPM7_9BURK|nr:succinate dehydrogenase, hydrophobic membrane anchor protein [Ottowia sp.]MBS0401440.1 succinate dehydrogenase, hydrophobic membrane anchor protein [Pseudomonadota bacterium]MBS0415350.1 succinate dehydrogenase, hydrophobic membrane anchor protein [Pseudomonadota bacterium]HMN56768.1 succinate dehydrogenase, hydrophobic membrane anchor protein [Ottowia sp.]
MSATYGYKRTVVGAHYGWRDFLVQRISAALMAVFTLVVLLQLLFTRGPIGYDTWSAIFAAQWMKALTFAVIVALLWHAWIGMCSIWYDYGKPAGLRLLLQALTVIWLVACGGWAVQVLWRL